MSRTDVVIVGSGPAGAATAILCAEKGIRVTIVERDESTRQHPGETLHPGIEPILGQLGVAKDFLSAGFLRHKGNWVRWEDKLCFVPFGDDERSEPWEGFQVRRPDFDNILLNRAQELGVDVIRSCKALRPIVNENNIVGIESSQGSLHSSFVIDAAGSQHWLAKNLGLKIKSFSSPLLTYFGYVEGECKVRNDAPCIVADKQGWTWTARISPHLYQWTRLFFKKQPIDKDWIPKEFHGLKQRGRTLGADVTWQIVSKPAGLGYFIVGDATAVLDPASSHGILKAMMSGMMAAHMISKIINDESLEKFAIQEYSRWVKEWFLHDVKRLKEFYAIHPNPPSWVKDGENLVDLSKENFSTLTVSQLK